MYNSRIFGFHKAVSFESFCIIDLHSASRRFHPLVLVPIILLLVFLFFGCGNKGSSSRVSSADVPQKAIVVFPPTNTIHVSVTPLLQWEDGGGADTYDVYLGTSEDKVTNAEIIDDSFMGNQSDTSYASAIGLAYEQDYYWRIDSANNNGKTRGDVWHFRTYNQDTVDAQNEKIHSIETIISDGRGPKLSPVGTEVAFVRLHGANPGVGHYEVYIADTDGKNEVCVSELCPDLGEGLHKGAVTWHPNGQWLLLVVEKDDYFGNEDSAVRALATGGIGINTDLWLLEADGSKAWQLTDLPTKMHAADTTPYTGILHPQFSHSGTRVLYAFTENPGIDVFGDWELRIADFNEPSLASVEHDSAARYEPGEKKHWYESHGWSADDSMIYFSFSPNPQQDDITTDIGVLNLTTNSYENLTDSWQEENTSWNGQSAWDEHAYLSKDNTILGYISSSGYPLHLDSDAERKNWRDWLFTEMWWINPTGEGQEQVSFFNDPTAPDYIGANKEAVPTGPSWNPETSAFLCGLGIRNLSPITDELLSWSYEIKVFWLDLDTNGLRDADES
ncbi:MAG: hypothetical protein PVI54_10115 [Desulfobacteraceae bacterium]|jgi:hypothetical protein